MIKLMVLSSVKVMKQIQVYFFKIRLRFLVFDDLINNNFST
jgi:hypothetical protein